MGIDEECLFGFCGSTGFDLGKGGAMLVGPRLDWDGRTQETPCYVISYWQGYTLISGEPGLKFGGPGKPCLPANIFERFSSDGVAHWPPFNWVYQILPARSVQPTSILPSSSAYADGANPKGSSALATVAVCHCEPSNQVCRTEELSKETQKTSIRPGVEPYIAAGLCIKEAPSRIS